MRKFLKENKKKGFLVSRLATQIFNNFNINHYSNNTNDITLVDN